MSALDTGFDAFRAFANPGLRKLALVQPDGQQRAEIARLVRNRPDAAKYRCPTTGVYILFTDGKILDELRRPGARFFCVGCNEHHAVSTAVACKSA